MQWHPVFSPMTQLQQTFGSAWALNLWVTRLCCHELLLVPPPEEQGRPVSPGTQSQHTSSHKTPRLGVEFESRVAQAPVHPPIPADAPPSFLASAGVGDQRAALWATEYFTAMLLAGVPNTGAAQLFVPACPRPNLTTFRNPRLRRRRARRGDSVSGTFGWHAIRELAHPVH